MESSHSRSHRLAAIVFTDIVGYTRQMEENEQRTMQLLEQQRRIIFPLVKIHNGEVIKEIGDGLLMMFDSAVEAVRFAMAVQTRLRDEALTIRAGIHIGDVIFREGDVFGSAVNTAARIEPLAPPNGICISEDVRNQIRNKTDIHTRHIGKKMLKGVDGPVDIYEILLTEEESASAPPAKRFTIDLWERKIIHIMAVYVVAAFLIRQAVAAVVYKNMLSPHLISLTWIILLSMIPTVFLLTYFHARKRAKGWHKAELIGLPVNVLVTVLLVVLLFRGKDLGAATKSLVLENEDGERIEKVVPKSEYRKRIALFCFENISGDASLDWLPYGIPLLLDYDMSQNMFVQSKSALKLTNRFEGTGYPGGIGAPLMLQKSVAEYYSLDYFVNGTFDFREEVFRLTTRLYATATGKLISQSEQSGKNIFELADGITQWLYDNLELNVYESYEIKDLPVSEIFTSSFKAFEGIIRGNTEILLSNNWTEGIKYIEQAIREDPGFAPAYINVAEYYFNNSQTDQAESAIQKALDNIYKLPERQQFNAKFFYYILRQEPDKAMSVLKMWTELYPEDIEAHDMLATRYQYKNMFREAIHEYRIILDIDPDQTSYIRYIGALYRTLGVFDSALHYYNRYAGLNPKDFKAYLSLAELYLNMGEFEQSISNLDKAMVLEPSNTEAAMSRIDVDLRLGKFEGAEERYLTLLPYCSRINDSTGVYEALSDYCVLTGQSRKALKYHEAYVIGMERAATPLNSVVMNLFGIEKYVHADRANDAWRIIKDAEKKFQPPVNKVVAFGYLQYYIAVDSASKAMGYVEKARELAIGFAEDVLLNNVLYSEGRILMLNNKYREALIPFYTFLENIPSGIGILRYIAECHRELGELNEAKKCIEAALKTHPYHPEYNFEAAMTHKASGDKAQALEHLRRAMEVWKDADEDYQPANKAQEELKELEAA